MAKQDYSQDRNFDDLAKRFARNIYGSLKGAIRLAVLERDIRAHTDFLADTPSRELYVLDAGGGQGQFSLELAKRGHKVVICDISEQMLLLAQEQVEREGLTEQVTLLHCPLQEVGERLAANGIATQQFDVVICHAVMEWLAEPQALLPCLHGYMKPGGFLSLIFYNVHSLIYKNLLRVNYQKVLDEDYRGYRGSLTPINPLLPSDVLNWVAQMPFKCHTHSGIRVFNDFILNREEANRLPETVIELELKLSQQEPYRSLGRYQHLLLERLD